VKTFLAKVVDIRDPSYLDILSAFGKRVVHNFRLTASD
jgi:hypothetical protein